MNPSISLEEQFFSTPSVASNASEGFQPWQLIFLG